LPVLRKPPTQPLTAPPRNFVVKKLLDRHDCDLDVDDTIGSIYEDEAVETRILQIVPGFVDRDDSLPPTTSLRPRRSSKKRTRRTSQEPEDNREKSPELGMPSPPALHTTVSARKPRKVRADKGVKRQKVRADKGVKRGKVRKDKGIKRGPRQSTAQETPTPTRPQPRPRKTVSDISPTPDALPAGERGSAGLVPQEPQPEAQHLDPENSAPSSAEASRLPARYLTHSPTPEESDSDDGSEASRSRSQSQVASPKLTAGDKSSESDGTSDSSDDASAAQPPRSSGGLSAPVTASQPPRSSGGLSRSFVSASQPPPKSSSGPSAPRVSASQPPKSAGGASLVPYRLFPSLKDQLAAMQKPTPKPAEPKPKPTPKPALQLQQKTIKNIFAPDYVPSDNESSSNTSDSGDDL
jgi:hypothetical protein